MTTGRINQVTIVCRGWPTGAVRHRRDFQVTGWRPKTRPPERCRLGLQRRVGQSAFPLQVPQGVRPPHRSLHSEGVCGLGAPGGGLSAQFLPLRYPLRVVASRCSVSGLDIVQPSTEPIWQRSGKPSRYRYTPVGVRPEPPRSWGSTNHYEPPGREVRSLQACMSGHAVEVCKIRYTERERRTFHRFRLGCFAPSHIPTDGLLVGRTPDRARGPLFIFRKIHLYGKTKKSTHGHQTAKPFCTHFFQSLHTD